MLRHLVTAHPKRRLTPRNAALAMGVLVVLVLTLTPGKGRGPIDPCDWCGATATSDALRNILLFVPLGALMVWNGWRADVAVAAAALLSFAVEAAQFLVPGRQPSVIDLLTNTLGAALGAWLVRTAAFWWRPPRSRALMLAGAGALAAATVWLGTPALLRPAFPVGRYFGQWAPQFGDYALYGGRIKEASIAGMALPSRALPRSDEVRAALLAGFPLSVRVLAGLSARGVAPIFSLADGPHRFIVMIAADGDDLVVGYRTRAAALRLDQPNFRVSGALRGVRMGAPLLLTLQFDHGGVCVSVDGARSCPRFNSANGWAFLGFPVGIGSATAALLNSLWSVGLVLPTCYWLACALKRAR